MTSTFGITYTDIQAAMRGFDLSDLSTEVAAEITRAAAHWHSMLKREGIVSSDVGIGDTLYALSQQWLILSVSAEMARRFSHQDPAISQARERKAAEIAQLLRDVPEAVYDAWDVNEQRGSFRTNRRLYSREPGDTSVRRGSSRKPWGGEF